MTSKMAIISTLITDHNHGTNKQKSHLSHCFIELQKKRNQEKFFLKNPHLLEFKKIDC